MQRASSCSVRRPRTSGRDRDLRHGLRVPVQATRGAGCAPDWATRRRAAACGPGSRIRARAAPRLRPRPPGGDHLAGRRRRRRHARRRAARRLVGTRACVGSAHDRAAADHLQVRTPGLARERRREGDRRGDLPARGARDLQVVARRLPDRAAQARRGGPPPPAPGLGQRPQAPAYAQPAAGVRDRDPARPCGHGRGGAAPHSRAADPARGGRRARGLRADVDRVDGALHGSLRLGSHPAVDRARLPGGADTGARPVRRDVRPLVQRAGLAGGRPARLAESPTGSIPPSQWWGRCSPSARPSPRITPAPTSAIGQSDERYRLRSNQPGSRQYGDPMQGLEDVEVVDGEPVAASLIPRAVTAGELRFDDGATQMFDGSGDTSYVEADGRPTQGKWYVDEDGRFCSFWPPTYRACYDLLWIVEGDEIVGLSFTELGRGTRFDGRYTTLAHGAGP